MFEKCDASDNREERKKISTQLYNLFKFARVLKVRRDEFLSGDLSLVFTLLGEMNGTSCKVYLPSPL